MKKRTVFFNAFFVVLLAFSAAALPLTGQVTLFAAQPQTLKEEPDPAGSSGAAADSADAGEVLWSSDYYRAADTTGGLSDAERASLDENCIAFMQSSSADLALLAVTPDQYEGYSLEELADGYYADCGFGYGDQKDGFQMVWDTDTDEVLIRAYGAAQELIPESYLEYVAGSVTKFKEDYGVYGPLYATVRYLSNYVRGGGDEAAAQEAPADAGTPASGADGISGTGEFNNDAAERSQQADVPEEDPDAPGASDAPDASNVSDASNASDAPDASDAGSTSAAAALKPADGEFAGGSSSAQEAQEGQSPLSDRDRMLPDGEMPDPSLRLGADAEAAGKPAWYPREPLTFPFYHDETAPRVVDTADIFSDEEEEQMEERLAELRAQLQRDIVIFTDTSTYGLSRSVYAADFYDFNGYGCGDDREGVCLMICMDPYDRGWWACCTGPVTMGLYSETVANQIDDLLFEYMSAGDYGTGVADWIENFRRLYTTGSPYNEEWAVLPEEDLVRFRDPDAPRVVDDAGILRENEIQDLTLQASNLSEKYGVDVVIHTALNPGILSRDDYSRRFYAVQGYGSGDNYDGIMLTIFKRPNYSGSVRVFGSGSGLDKLTEVNQDRLENRCEDLVLHRDYYEAASQWLDQTGHMLRTGRAPRSAGSWGFATALELLAGLIFGGVSLGRAKSRMRTPKIKENANGYLVPGSLHIRKVKDHLVNTTTSRAYSPIKRESSGGGGSSSGHSSYSGGYSGSSGSSHSGSGRSF